MRAQDRYSYALKLHSKVRKSVPLFISRAANVLALREAVLLGLCEAIGAVCGLTLVAAVRDGSQEVRILLGALGVGFVLGLLARDDWSFATLVDRCIRSNRRSGSQQAYFRSGRREEEPAGFAGIWWAAGRLVLRGANNNIISIHQLRLVVRTQERVGDWGPCCRTLGGGDDQKKEEYTRHHAVSICG